MTASCPVAGVALPDNESFGCHSKGDIKEEIELALVAIKSIKVRFKFYFESYKAKHHTNKQVKEAIGICSPWPTQSEHLDIGVSWPTLSMRNALRRHTVNLISNPYMYFFENVMNDTK